MRAFSGGSDIDFLVAPVDSAVSAVAFEETPQQEHAFSLFTLSADGTSLTSIVPILRQTPGRFRLVTPRQDLRREIVPPFFFQDDARVFAVTTSNGRYRFSPFYHASVDRFVRVLSANGIDGLLQREVQKTPAATSFADVYGPFDIVDRPYPTENVTFDTFDAYAQYNWELFFHAPLLIADRLSKSQRFADAQRWFHCIFDPMDNSDEPIPARYWRTLPLYKASAGIAAFDELRHLLAHGDSQSAASLDVQVARWRLDSFNPHVIARLRSSAYPKAVVMKYIDN